MAYFKNKREVIAVYLFGSHAEDKERHLSDIDIGILLDSMDRDFDKERKSDYIVELGRVMRKDIDPVILNSASEEVLRQIFLKGNCILVNDSKKLARYRRENKSPSAFSVPRTSAASGRLTNRS